MDALKTMYFSEMSGEKVYFFVMGEFSLLIFFILYKIYSY